MLFILLTKILIIFSFPKVHKYVFHEDKEAYITQTGAKPSQILSSPVRSLLYIAAIAVLLVVVVVVVVLFYFILV